MLYIILLILITYIVASIHKYKGIPISLSDTYFLWKKWFFPFVMWLTGLVLLPYWLDFTTDSNWEFLPFISCIGIICVGAAPNIRTDKQEYRIHMICAYLAALAATASIFIICDKWYVLPLITICNFILCFKEIKNKYIFLIELSIFEAVFYTLIYDI